MKLITPNSQCTHWKESLIHTVHACQFPQNMNWLLQSLLCYSNCDWLILPIWTILLTTFCEQWWGSDESNHFITCSSLTGNINTLGHRVWSVTDTVHSSCEVSPQFVSHWHSACMDFLQWNLSPLFLFAHNIDVNQTSSRHHEHSDEHNANKHVCLLHSIQKEPIILQSPFSCKISVGCVWMYSGNTRFPTLCVNRT